MKILILLILFLSSYSITCMANVDERGFPTQSPPTQYDSRGFPLQQQYQYYQTQPSQSFSYTTPNGSFYYYNGPKYNEHYYYVEPRKHQHRHHNNNW